MTGPRCSVGRSEFRSHDAVTRCPLPPLPGKMFCGRHWAEALARVTSAPKFTPEGKPKRWAASYMVSGSSRE